MPVIKLSPYFFIHYIIAIYVISIVFDIFSEKSRRGRRNVIIPLMMMIGNRSEHVHILVNRHKPKSFVHIEESKKLAAKFSACHTIRKKVYHVICIHHKIHECPQKSDVLRRLCDIISLHQAYEN